MVGGARGVGRLAWRLWPLRAEAGAVPSRVTLWPTAVGRVRESRLILFDRTSSLQDLTRR